MTSPVTQRLFTVSEIASFLGVTNKWVHNELNRRGANAPRPEFTAHIGGRSPILLWPEHDMVRWEAYYASLGSIPATVTAHSAYSDHRAVNMLRKTTVTWKLWWRCSSDGPVWWFSTPAGWWVSDDDGRGWRDAGCMIRPTEYHYFSVNGTAKPSPALSGIIRSATKLRRRLEK